MLFFNKLLFFLLKWKIKDILTVLINASVVNISIQGEISDLNFLT